MSLGQLEVGVLWFCFMCYSINNCETGVIVITLQENAESGPRAWKKERTKGQTIPKYDSC